MAGKSVAQTRDAKSSTPEISATIPDWSREKISRFWDPGYKLLRTVRRYQKAKAQGGPLGWFLSKYWSLVHRFWSVVTQSEIHLKTHIEGGLRLPHPTGIIIHPDARIGPNCQIFHQVTLVSSVVMGGHVDIGAGAKIIGPLTIGDHVEVGANSVVTKDVESGTTVAGVPARVLGPRKGIASKQGNLPDRTHDLSGKAQSDDQDP